MTGESKINCQKPLKTSLMCTLGVLNTTELFNLNNRFKHVLRHNKRQFAERKF